jgi:hypothetical protein
MREGPRRRAFRTLLAVCLLAGAAAPSFGGDPAEGAPAAAKAKARVVAKDYAGAFKLYAALIEGTKDVDRETLVDAASAACLAVRPREAAAWRNRALKDAPEAFLSSPKGKEAAELAAKIEAASGQKVVDDRARAAGYVAATIKALLHDQDLLHVDWLEKATSETGKPAEDEGPPFRVRAELIDDPRILRGTWSPTLDGRHLRVHCQETFEDKAAAEARLKAIVAQAREQRPAWERQFRLRTAKDRYELKEVSDVRYGEPADVDMIERTNMVTFVWSVPGYRTMPAVATITLDFPLESKTDPRKNGKVYCVRTWLDSTWLK